MYTDARGAASLLVLVANDYALVLAGKFFLVSSGTDIVLIMVTLLHLKKRVRRITITNSLYLTNDITIITSNK